VLRDFFAEVSYRATDTTPAALGSSEQEGMDKLVNDCINVGGFIPITKIEGQECRH